MTKKTTLDIYWAKAVKEKAGNLCIFNDMNCSGTLNAHHVIHRSNHAVRWYLPNGVSLCNYHHTLGSFSAHQNPIWFIDKMTEFLGEKWKEDLIIKCSKIFRWKKFTDEIKLYLKGQGEYPL